MLPEVNLLPKIERTESRLYAIFITGLILLLIAIGIFIYLFISTNNRLEAAEQRVATLETEKEVLEVSLAAHETDDTGPSFIEAIAYIEEHRLPTSKLVDEYINLLPDHAYLSDYDFDYNSVSIQTQFETIPDTSTYVADLTASDLLEDVFIDSISTFEVGDMGMNEDEVERLAAYYENIPRYDVSYSMEVNHENLVREVEDDETAISGE